MGMSVSEILKKLDYSKNHISNDVEAVEFEIFNQANPDLFSNVENFELFKKQLLVSAERFNEEVGSYSRGEEVVADYIFSDAILYIISLYISFFMISPHLDLAFLSWINLNHAFSMLVSFFLWSIFVGLRDYFFEKFSIKSLPKVDLFFLILSNCKNNYSIGVAFPLIVLIFIGLLGSSGGGATKKYGDISMTCKSKAGEHEFVINSEHVLKKDKKYEILKLKEKD